MEPLKAEILTEHVTGDGRVAVRRSLRLAVSARSSGDAEVALILNISETGFLIETWLKLAVGETLRVDIPEASASMARVVWTDGLRAGCEFVSPISTGSVSAAQLKSPAEALDSTYEVPAADTNVPVDDDLGDLDDDPIQTEIVVITTVISVLALLIFLAAMLAL
jgi:hypothetical protein